MRFAAFTLLSLATVAVAAPANLSLESRTSCENNNVCQGGDTYCCNDGPQLHNATTGSLLAVPFNLLAGLQCSALTVLGIVVVSSCPKTTVCCQNTSQSGLINIQCLAITL